MSSAPHADLIRPPTAVLTLGAGVAIESRFAAHHVQDHEYGEHDE
jgi:hypothetical protein